MKALKKGKWAGEPWTGCPYCPHGITGDNQDARMEQHIVSRHATKLRENELEAMGGTAPATDSVPIGNAGHAAASSKATGGDK